MLSFHPLQLLERSECGEEALCLTFAVPAALRADYRFTAGQHVAVRAQLDGRELRRTYSIVDAEGAAVLRLAVRIHPRGAMSGFLADQLKVGDSLDVMTPGGSFVLPEPAGAGRAVAAFVAGSGITPVLSIVSTLLAREPASRVLLFYGNRNSARTMLLEDIQALKNRYLDRFAVFFVMSQEPQDVELLNGRLDASKLRALAAGVFDAAGIDQYLLCGPGTMNEDLGASLRALGVAAARIHKEHFAVAEAGSGAGAGAAPTQAARPAAAPAAAAAAQITVRMGGRRRAFTMQMHGDSILEAAASAGIELPYSCRAGVCSTCRTKLISGKVEMAQNYALEDWEIDAGFVLCCQSRPLTPEIEISYDEI